jgi:hypothetical protein
LEEHVISIFRVKEYAKQKNQEKELASSARLHGVISWKIELYAIYHLQNSVASINGG